ncbi:MAG: hypothetical protein A2521_03870 [Deltaproteobacteria bacterium RIFOXYD12_FULL_57_12]|nr:MAG: hypothetical protein A2521_03870 [Deltaproteobacteria bacterium RIFOXYD12_FULL_57_12]
MLRHSTRFVYFCGCLALLLLLCQPAALLAEPSQKAVAPVKVALLPFAVNAATSMDYLKNGIRDMLATRLAANTGAAIISNDLVAKTLVETGGEARLTSPAALQDLGMKLGADYLVSGSMTAIGGSVSLDAKVLAMAKPAEAAQTFYATAPKEDDVLVAINQMAWEISEKVFGKTRPGSMAPAPAGPAPQESAAYQTAHPDRAFLYPSAGGTYGPKSPFIRPTGITGAMGFTKSQNFNMEMQAMDVGDVDGDGTIDVVLADKTKVTIYQRTNNQFRQIGQIPVRGVSYSIHAVSVADLNNNGRAEIYVSAADTKKPDSFALEWNGKEFAYLFDKAPWYIKTLTQGDGTTILAGQQADITAPIKPGIYEIKPEAEPHIIQKLQIPAKVNLFDFSYADIDKDGQAEIVALDQSDRLQVMRPDGRGLWKSDEYFGGTKRYIGEAIMDGRSTSITADSKSKERTYIPGRIIVPAKPAEGSASVILNKNLSSASRVFKNMKSYPSGEIHGLAWNGISLEEIWRTRKIDGYIVDYQVVPDPANPAKAELFVGVVLGGELESVLSGGGQSTVLMYSLDTTAGQ